MNLRNKWVAILLLVLPTNVFACFPARVSIEKRVERATEIYVGVVNEVLSDKEENQSTDVINSISQLPKAYSLKISVTEILKGKNNKTSIQPKILNCGSGKASLNDKVIVFFNGKYWYTTKFEEKNYLNILSLTK